VQKSKINAAAKSVEVTQVSPQVAPSRKGLRKGLGTASWLITVIPRLAKEHDVSQILEDEVDSPNEMQIRCHT